MTDEMIETTRRDLADAIQAYMVAAHGPGIVTNWTVCAESVDGNDARNLYLGMNQDMTRWMLLGMSVQAMRLVQELFTS